MYILEDRDGNKIIDSIFEPRQPRIFLSWEEAEDYKEILYLDTGKEYMIKPYEARKDNNNDGSTKIHII